MAMTVEDLDGFANEQLDNTRLVSCNMTYLLSCSKLYIQFLKLLAISVERQSPLC